MVIKGAIIRGLRLHVLIDFLKRSLSFKELTMKQLQLSTRPFHTISAPVDFDFTSFGQSKSCLTESKRLGQRNDFTLPLVDHNTGHLKPLNNNSGDSFKFFDIRQNDIVIIHIVPSTVNPKLAFDKVINVAGQRYHLLLAWFNTKRHSPARYSTRRFRNNQIRKRS